jgi:hypothetical protein
MLLFYILLLCCIYVCAYLIRILTTVKNFRKSAGKVVPRKIAKITDGAGGEDTISDAMESEFGKVLSKHDEKWNLMFEKVSTNNCIVFVDAAAGCRLHFLVSCYEK